MKAKKLVALIMSAAMVVGVASMFAACDKDKDKDKDPGETTNPGGTNPGGTNPGGTTDPGTNPGENTFVNDTNTYYAVGDGVGTMKDNGWSPSNANIPFTKDTTVTDSNVFTLELTMYAGDSFKVLFDTEKGWSGTSINYYSLQGDYQTYFGTNTDSNIICQPEQDGVYLFTLTTDLTKTEWSEQYVLTVEQKSKVQIPYQMKVMGDVTTTSMVKKGEGVWSLDVEVKDRHLLSDENGNEATADTETKYALLYVHNSGAGANEGEPMNYCDLAVKHAEVTVEGDTFNANLLDVGKYIITFNENDGSVKVEKITDEWHVVLGGTTGAVLNYSGETKLWTGEITLTAETEVKLTNTGNDEAEDVTVGTLEAGTWVIQYDAENDKLEYEVYTYWIVGTFLDADDNTKNFEIVKGLTPVMTKTENENEYTATLEVVDISGVEAYSWAAGVFQIKVVIGTSLTGVKTWNISGENNIPVTGGAGTYTVTMDVTNENSLQITPVQ